MLPKANNIKLLTRLSMKWILLSVCGGSLLFTTGCLSSDAEWRGHTNNERFGGFLTEAPAGQKVAAVSEAPAPAVQAH